MIQTPETTAEWSWSGRNDYVALRFVGRGPEGRRAALAATGPAPARLAWAEQIHSARVLAARDGGCGQGDALVTREPGLALAIATADCVPLVLGARRRLAAVHAGWRGIAAGIVGAAVTELSPAHELSAWIGPAIGPCCYEVGEEVAAQVAAVAGEAVIVRPPRGERPHLDLVAAVRAQLTALGVATVQSLGLCTRCSPGLWSYRGGGGAGRNWAFAWLTG